ESRAEALVIAVDNLPSRINHVDAVVRSDAVREAMRRAEEHPQGQPFRRGQDVTCGGGQFVPVDGPGVGDVDAGVTRQGRLGEMDDVSTGPASLLDLPQDKATVVADAGLDRELTGSDAEGFHPVFLVTFFTSQRRCDYRPSRARWWPGRRHAG